MYRCRVPFFSCSRSWLAVFVAFAIIACVMISYVLSPNNAFDGDLWTKATSVADGRRAAMASTLIDRQLLIGKTKGEVERLLGQSDHNKDSSTYYYLLGPSTSGIINTSDCAWLAVNYNEGVVIQCWLHHD